jgi:hypothetical protein
VGAYVGRWAHTCMVNNINVDCVPDWQVPDAPCSVYPPSWMDRTGTSFPLAAKCALVRSYLQQPPTSHLKTGTCMDASAYMCSDRLCLFAYAARSPDDSVHDSAEVIATHVCVDACVPW